MVIVVLLVVLAVIAVAGYGILRLMRANAEPLRAGAAAARRGVGSGPIDPFTLGEPWRFFVRDALQAQGRFNDAVRQARPGPLRDRLTEIGAQLEVGIRRCWATAQEGQALREARKRIDTRQTEARIAQLEGGGDPNAASTVASLRAQLASAERLDTVTTQAESKLRLLQAQLDESVAKAAELSVRAGDVGELAGLGDEITQVAEQMEALRLALEETSGGPASTSN